MSRVGARLSAWWSGWVALMSRREEGTSLALFRIFTGAALLLTLGSVIGTMQEVIDEMREQGTKVGAVTIRTFRPFPLAALRRALERAKRVVVFEKCLAVGMGGVVSNNVHMTLRRHDMPVYSVIGGLGGRPITRASLRAMLDRARADQLDETHFLDLNCEVVDKELEREQANARSGSIAENILRDIGVVGAAKTA